MARQPDHPHVVAEVLAAELGPDLEPLGHAPDLVLQLGVADGVAARVAARRQVVEVATGGELHRLHRELRRRAADDDREVVGRTGRRAERLHLLLEEGQEALAAQDRRRLLVEERLVGRAAALGDEEEVVLVAAGGVELELGRQVGARVLLLEGRERRHLRVAEVGLLVDVEDAARERVLVAGARPHPLPLLAEDDRGAGVLARRQHHAGRDAGVPQHVERDEAVVHRRLGVLEDLPELRQVTRAEEVRDVTHGLVGEPRQRRGIDGEDALAPEAVGADPRRLRASDTASYRRRAGTSSGSGTRACRSFRRSRTKARPASALRPARARARS